jgi:hypothetical protein
MAHNFAKYNYSDQIKEGKMANVCSMHGDLRIALKILVRKPEGKNFPGRPSWKWEDAHQMDLK